MQKIKRVSDILDRSTDLMIICIGISIVIFITILSINITNDYEEQECVKFYKENNYITKSCEIYKEKLEKMKK